MKSKVCPRCCGISKKTCIMCIGKGFIEERHKERDKFVEETYSRMKKANSVDLIGTKKRSAPSEDQGPIKGLEKLEKELAELEKEIT